MDLKQTEIIKRRYNRISRMFRRMDGMVTVDRRRSLLSEVGGDVLEVGVGTGANLPHYPPNVRLTGIDFSPGMLRYAREKADQLDLAVRLLEMDAQSMDFPDNSFDYVVTTCVFCSVPDPVEGLREIFRVCRPDGQVLMLEHMRSENPILGTVMDWLNPVTVRLTGANINRRTTDNIERAGLLITKQQYLLRSVFRELHAKPIKENQ